MRSKVWFLVLGIVVCVTASLFAVNMNSYVVNVGQGDGIVIQTPGGKVIVIDGGPSSATDSTNPIIAFLNKKGISTIDVLVLTHPHADHVTGATAILKTKTVKAVYDPKYYSSASCYTDFKNTIAAKGIPYYQAKTGTSYSWDSTLSIKCLNARSSAPEANDASTVLKITHGSNTLLWTGDASTDDTENNELASYSSYLPAKFLKVAHHGSSYASSTAFLNKVLPRYAYISVGAGNPYGHPASDALSRLSAAGALIYRTDTQGSLRITTTGTGSYYVGTNQ